MLSFQKLAQAPHNSSNLDVHMRIFKQLRFLRFQLGHRSRKKLHFIYIFQQPMGIARNYWLMLMIGPRLLQHIWFLLGFWAFYLRHYFMIMILCSSLGRKHHFQQYIPIFALGLWPLFLLAQHKKAVLPNSWTKFCHGMSSFRCRFATLLSL